jgi:hypothetical protein
MFIRPLVPNWANLKMQHREARFVHVLARYGPEWPLLLFRQSFIRSKTVWAEEALGDLVVRTFQFCNQSDMDDPHCELT